MTHNTSASESDYQDLHAAAVDALSWCVKPKDLDQAAREVLDKFRDYGFSIPADLSA